MFQDSSSEKASNRHRTQIMTCLSSYLNQLPSVVMASPTTELLGLCASLYLGNVPSFCQSRAFQAPFCPPWFNPRGPSWAWLQAWPLGPTDGEDGGSCSSTGQSRTLGRRDAESGWRAQTHSLSRFPLADVPLFVSSIPREFSFPTRELRWCVLSFDF